MSFSVEQEFRKGELFLALKLNVKCSGPARIFYLADLKELLRHDQALSAFLFQEHCKSLGISPVSQSAHTLSCNVLYVRASQSLEAMQKLIQAKALFGRGESFFFNPFSQSKNKILFEVEASERNNLQICGFLHLDGRVEKMEDVGFLFKGKPTWGICKQIVFVVPPEIHGSDLDWIYPHPKRLEGKETQRFLEEYRAQKDLPSGLEVVWKGNVLEQDQEHPPLMSVLPCLVLKDRQGAFADLYMEYEENRVDIAESFSVSGRNVKEEKAWERDLLETDFVLKILPSSRYYCPMDKVASSLSFLLEIGWKILDAHGRRVMRIGDSDLSLLPRSDGIVLAGRMRYGEHEVDVKQVLGAFNRRERFVEIGANVIGLLDHSKEYEGLQDLSGEIEEVSEGCLIPPRCWGLLETLLEGTPSSCQSFLERLQGMQVKKEEMKWETFRGELRPYQKAGVEWLAFLQQHRLSGLLADEMGLGKTIQVLAFFSMNSFSSNKPLLIVVPTSLVFNWRREWEQFLPQDGTASLYVHTGIHRSQELDFLQRQKAVLTSYALLRNDFSLFQKLLFSCVVLDEAQWIKNPESQIAKASYALQSDMKICLSGTPIENRLDDLWSLFHFLEPQLLGERKAFLQALGAAEVDARYVRKIHKMIRPFTLRRMKEEVAQDLPEKIEQVVYVEMDSMQKAFYEEMLAKTRAGVLHKAKLAEGRCRPMEVLEAILRLRQICCHPLLVSAEATCIESCKLERVLQDVEEVVSEGRKVLIYSQFTQMLQLIQNRIQERGWSYVYLDGDTKDRESRILTFQTDPATQIFLISLKAGGVGLNLTAADYVFLFDPWWNEAAEKQAIDRAHRLGRKGSVIARRYIVAESIEEKVMKLKEHKRLLAEGVLTNLDETLDKLGSQEDISMSIEELIALL